MTTAHPTLYKVLNPDGTPAHGGLGTWSLPHDGQPGDWMPRIHGALKPCVNGYHAATAAQLLTWDQAGAVVYSLEYRGQSLETGDKWVCREARLLALTPWTQRTRRLFAADCAEHVLPIYESAYPGDTRVRDCIAIARHYAQRHATRQELDAAQAHEREWQTARLEQYLTGKV